MPAAPGLIKTCAHRSNLVPTVPGAMPPLFKKKDKTERCPIDMEAARPLTKEELHEKQLQRQLIIEQSKTLLFRTKYVAIVFELNISATCWIEVFT